MKQLIKDSIDCTEAISALTKEKELYALTSNEINLNLFNPSIGVKKQMLLYSFLKEFHAKLTVYLTQKRERKNI
ncbi:hypothetical protein [Bacillus cereus]|uniref:hypothetical protein n=1 Tax=Bacillus cereus TaxID=1396 RepID=UPI001F45A7F1|nr:hypothetical protein [Bacillus cereus]BCD16938.1 hypothetical protein BC30077_1714 [Bacillus cereus]